MYKILSIKDTVRVPPVKFDMPLEKAVKESLQEQIEGTIDPNFGVFLVVTEVTEVGNGRIVPEDGAVHYPATYKILTFRPEENEILLGEIVDITEFGAFTRIGPIDALVHVSQIMDDKVAYDPKSATFTGKKTGLKLKEGDIVRVRVVGVSLGKNKTKISLTMRQPELGAVAWIDKDKKTTRKPARAEKAEKPAKKEKK